MSEERREDRRRGRASSGADFVKRGRNQYRNPSVASTNDTPFVFLTRMLNLQGGSIYSRDVRDDADIFDNGYSDGRVYHTTATSQKPVTQLMEKSFDRQQTRHSIEGIWSAPENIPCDVIGAEEEGIIRNVFKNTEHGNDFAYNSNLDEGGENKSRQTEPMKYILLSPGMCTDPRCPSCALVRSLTGEKGTRTMGPKIKEITDKDAETQCTSVREKLDNSSRSSIGTLKKSEGNKTNTISKNENSETAKNKMKDIENKKSKISFPQNKESFDAEKNDQTQEYGIVRDRMMNLGEMVKGRESNEIQKEIRTVGQSPIDSVGYPGKEKTWNKINVGSDETFTSESKKSTDYRNLEHDQNVLATNVAGIKNIKQYSVEDSDEIRKSNRADAFEDDEKQDNLDYSQNMDSYDNEHTIDDIPEETSEKLSTSNSTHESGRYGTGVTQFFNMSIFMKSIRRFADNNDFEIHDDIYDGNCMFRAVVDQMIINGDFSFTAHSLRLYAIRFLRENPYHTDGSHLESFLSTETWSEYLMRMENNSQWGDHMMLKAIADALNLVVVVINVYEDDVRITEIQPADSNTSQRRIHIHLGHIGEFHYLSLRPSNWETTWPYKAVLQRLKACESTKETSKFNIDNKIKTMGIKQYIEEAELTLFQSSPSAQLSSEVPLQEKKLSGKPYDSAVHSNRVDKPRPLVKTYGLQKLQTEESIDSRQCLIEDPLCVDSVTGLPIPHLSYIMEHVMSLEFMYDHFMIFLNPTPTYEIYGKCGAADRTNVLLLSLKEDKNIKFYQELKKSKMQVLIYCRLDYDVDFHDDLYRQRRGRTIIADTSSTYPGYCRLIPGIESKKCWENQLYQENSEVFIKGFPSSSQFQEKFENPLTKRVDAYKCKRFPPCAREWEFRNRPYNWPSSAIISEILSLGCAVIQSAHPNSSLPIVEWKIIFTKCEQVIMAKGISELQKHAFYIFKIVIEYMTRHLVKQLKGKHLKSVFFYASEKIPEYAWGHCFGGCVLYLCSSLLDSLQKKCIPHYFIPNCNLLDGYSHEEIETVCVYVEAFRTFPVESICFMCERHGFENSFTFASLILKDSAKFSNDKDLNRAFNCIFIPNLMQHIQIHVQSLSKLPLDEAFYQLIKNNYDMSLTIPGSQNSTDDEPSFSRFFENALKHINDQETKEKLVKHYEKDCGCTSQITQNKHAKCLKNFIRGEVDNKVGCIEIPESNTEDILSVASYLDTIAYNYFMAGNGEMAFLCEEAAIKCAKQSLEDMIDVSEIEDKTLKEEISRLQTTRVTMVNSTLWTYYNNLYRACSVLGSFERLRGYMNEMEDFCKRMPSLKSLVSLTWNKLGNVERSLMFKTDEKDESFGSVKFITL